MTLITQMLKIIRTVIFTNIYEIEWHAKERAELEAIQKPLLHNERLRDCWRRFWPTEMPTASRPFKLSIFQNPLNRTRQGPACFAGRGSLLPCSQALKHVSGSLNEVSLVRGIPTGGVKHSRAFFNVQAGAISIFPLCARMCTYFPYMPVAIPARGTLQLLVTLRCLKQSAYVTSCLRRTHGIYLSCFLHSHSDSEGFTV